LYTILTTITYNILNKPPLISPLSTALDIAIVSLHSLPNNNHVHGLY